MAKYLATIKLVTTNDVTKEEVEELLDNIINCELPTRLENKIDKLTYSDELGEKNIVEIED